MAIKSVPMCPTHGEMSVERDDAKSTTYYCPDWHCKAWMRVKKKLSPKQRRQLRKEYKRAVYGD